MRTVIKEYIVAQREENTELYIDVLVWQTLGPVTGQYIERKFDIRYVLNYISRLGIRSVLDKVRSRRNEKKRNRKVAALGLGRVVAAPIGKKFNIGDVIVFFAPNHPDGSQRLALNEDLVIGYDAKPAQVLNSSSVAGFLEALSTEFGWSSLSGKSLNKKLVRTQLQKYSATLRTDSLLANHCNVVDARYSNIRVAKRCVYNGKSKGKHKTAVIFGLGNYAKTIVLPAVRRSLKLCCIHEIDPDQLQFMVQNDEITLDTSPVPRDQEMYDAWFVAGYHHTHAEIGLVALRQSAYAVLEKPLATTRQQYHDIKMSLTHDRKSRLFACFQRRYSVFNAYLEADVGSLGTAPLDMHCIVYETPLPPLHWYNWPNSGSRLISNGCHWIDYFMFVNGYPEVECVQAWSPRGDDVCAQITLKNGAYFTMTLTDRGCERLGVRDYIELRTENTTISVVDAARYRSETGSRILRKCSVNPMSAYRTMYRNICYAIKLDREGDPIKSLRSTEATLRLEEDLGS